MPSVPQRRVLTCETSLVRIQMRLLMTLSKFVLKYEKIYGKVKECMRFYDKENRSERKEIKTMYVFWLFSAVKVNRFYYLRNALLTAYACDFHLFFLPYLSWKTEENDTFAVSIL